MIVERTAAKQSLAVTLALAIGLVIPGSAWSQTYNARVVPVAPVSGAQSAAAVSGVQTAASLVPSLPVNSLSLTAAAVLAAPAAAPAAPAALAAAPSAAAAVSRPGAAPVASAAKVAQLASISASVASQASADETKGIEVVSVGSIFDGSRTPVSDMRTGDFVLPQGRSGRTYQPSLAPALSAAPAEANATQRRMLRSLYQVASVFAEQYAPLDLKKSNFQLDLKREYDKVKVLILANPDITTRQYQDLLAKMVASMRDYHVSISFNSTESSKLHFQVIGAEGRYYLAYIDREKLPLEVFPFKTGDEVVGFDGQKTADAVKAIADRMTSNTKQTDLRMAELFLTNRRRARGDNDIPQGKAVIVINSKGKLYQVAMPWDYTPELVAQDVPVRNAGLLEPEGTMGAAAAGPVSGGFFSSIKDAFSAAVHPLVDLFSDIRAESGENGFMIGARQSFVPKLGQVLWRSSEDDHFDAYIFKAKDGRKMGYIRIAAYDGENKEVREFAKVMARFQVETEALVIDQVSNPGGNLFYLYALASHLTDKPLATPRHRMIIGENDAQQSADTLLQFARQSKMSPEAKEKAKAKAKRKKSEGDEESTASGYPITGKFIALMLRSASYILKQFTAGNRYTGLTHIGGVDDIDPAPKAEERYTKPILLLTNALDFSGGDFFPAIMQDSKRATILGVRTAGAGGIVKPFAAGGMGVARLSATTTLAERANGQPIENLGVTPDIPYELSAKDLRTGFAEYRWAILKALNGLLSPAQ